MNGSAYEKRATALQNMHDVATSTILRSETKKALELTHRLPDASAAVTNAIKTAQERLASLSSAVRDHDPKLDRMRAQLQAALSSGQEEPGQEWRREALEQVELVTQISATTTSWASELSISATQTKVRVLVLFEQCLETAILRPEPEDLSVRAIVSVFQFAIGLLPTGPAIDAVTKLWELYQAKAASVQTADKVLGYLESYSGALEVWLSAVEVLTNGDRVAERR